MPRGPRALVFDFDGVIADDEPLHLAAFQEALAAEGITLTREAYYARYLGFDDHDAVVEALREAGRPAPPERLRALERLRGRLPDLAPRDCLVVEDSQPGVESARRAGMRCLAVTNSYPAEALGGADLVVSSLEEAGWDRLASLF